MLLTCQIAAPIATPYSYVNAIPANCGTSYPQASSWSTAQWSTALHLEPPAYPQPHRVLYFGSYTPGLPFLPPSIPPPPACPQPQPPPPPSPCYRLGLQWLHLRLLSVGLHNSPYYFTFLMLLLIGSAYCTEVVGIHAFFG